MNNVLIRLIDQGKVRTLDDLKSAYHTLLMKTHPDAAGSDMYLEDYLLLGNHYLEAMTNWNRDWAELYEHADREYARIKAEKPTGPYLKHALALNIRPLVHNLIAYHLTGRDVYMKQARQNLSGIMHQLTENKCEALRQFLSILLEDMRQGPAVLDDNKDVAALDVVFRRS